MLGKFGLEVIDADEFLHGLSAGILTSLVKYWNHEIELSKIQILGAASFEIFG
jgi:hypothetical protein